MTFDIRECSYFEAAKKKFLSNVNKTDTCWLWTAGKTLGYGYFYIDGQDYRAHRLSYMIFNGPIPYDKIVRHTCDNKACVNPKHLILGSYADNSADAVKRNRYLGDPKLTLAEVKVIKWMLKHHSYFGINKKLAEIYNVSSKTIAGIKSGHSWKWVKI